MKRVYLAAGLAGLLMFLLAGIPAQLLYHWSRNDQDLQTQAVGLSGNLWHGQAASINLSGFVLRELQWRWRPQALLIGRISHRMTARTDTGSINATVSSTLFGNTLRITALDGSLPVEQLGPSLKLPVLPLSGNLQFAFKRLYLRAGKPWLAEGGLDFSNLSFSFSSPPTLLGNYHADLSTVERVIQLQLRSDSGQLEASGTGQITREGQYALDLKLRPRAAAQAPVISLLQPLGRPDAEGWYPLRHNGSF